MRTVIQRVRQASVSIDGSVYSSINSGLLVLAGFGEHESHEDLIWTCNKIIQMRIFPDQDGVMNKSVKEVGGDILVVSQFTLFASTKKGNRPSYIQAARPETAIPLYTSFCEMVQQALGKPISTGVFGADMQVSLVNDGPVTICIDSQKRE